MNNFFVKVILVCTCTAIVSCSLLHFNANNKFYRFKSKDGKSVYVGFFDKNGKRYADLRIGNGKEMQLDAECFDSGIRYSKNNNELYCKDDRIMFFENSKLVFDGVKVNKY